VSHNNISVNLLSKKFILSKIKNIYKNDDVDKLLYLFLNEQQTLRIKDKDIKNLNFISKYGQTEAIYAKLLKDIKISNRK
jgi:hypothetical protein